MNQRKTVYRADRGRLRKVKIPTELYEDFPSQYRVMEYMGEESSDTYFINMVNKNGTLMTFNDKDGAFSYYKIPLKDAEQRIAYRNSKGDLLIQTPSKCYLLKQDAMKWKDFS